MPNCASKQKKWAIFLDSPLTAGGWFIHVNSMHIQNFSVNQLTRNTCVHDTHPNIQTRKLNKYIQSISNDGRDQIVKTCLRSFFSWLCIMHHHSHIQAIHTIHLSTPKLEWHSVEHDVKCIICKFFNFSYTDKIYETLNGVELHTQHIRGFVSEFRSLWYRVGDFISLDNQFLFYSGSTLKSSLCLCLKIFVWFELC